MLTLDGSRGEGGGQILRTALALSLVTQQPFRITNVRAGRAKPGLLRQHLTAVQAATAISRGSVEGAVIGSRELTFRPSSPQGGHYTFSVGSAGSATLVFQTVLPALLLAAEPSSLVLHGGTHNPHAPPFEFLDWSFLPCIRRMGPAISARLDRAGFYPAGGGCIRVDIQPVSKLRSLELLERGELRVCRAVAMVAALGKNIADRELRVVAKRLNMERHQLQCLELEAAQGPGNILLICAESEHVTEVFAGFGERRVSAENVAERAARAAAEYLEAAVPVGEHLADQLLLPLALAGGGTFRSLAPSLHTATQAETIRLFLGVETRIRAESARAWCFEVNPNGKN